MDADQRAGKDAFIEALRADVVIEFGDHDGLSISNALALRDWWDRNRRVPAKEDE